ncbi:translation initiation factor IF-2 isoform X2 [Sorghum bicolor]|uniref:translation initiation factor IF-2 isoform X2 n=1 Tax=Sorghum bicolor TaxID=4558 RepID=UPI000B424955|nr:translation initiation factor IF-2 isoform X2 [Sorghum bicolor]|eukprot:XP_021301503.1 translation initiation factor IF-2 isoform X2 [Sorghum bicolor]
MRPSKSAAAPPVASLTSPKSCATKRPRKAAPLGDVTNLLLVVAETPTPSKPRRTARGALPAPSDVSAVSSACSSSASVTPAPKPSAAAAAAASATPVPKPSSAASVTPARKPSSTAVYRRTTEAQGRWRRDTAAASSKGEEPVAATARCPPLGKSARTNSREKDIRPISASAPCHEGKKKRTLAITPNLLEDLLEKQRAYFADIDAFELVEEEVSESELE